MTVFDAHFHLWDLTCISYPWLNQFEGLQRSFSLEEYRSEKSRAELRGGILVEADATPDLQILETQWLLETASAPENEIAGVIACLFPERSDFPTHLEAISSHPKLCGIRRVLYSQPREIMLSEEFSRNLRLLQKKKLTFDLCIAEEQLPAATALVDACPGVSFILDHCGSPDVLGTPFSSWRASITKLAKRQNVFCKISGLGVDASQLSSAVDQLYPWFHHAVESFGWDRIIWGSNWPVCRRTLSWSGWIDLTERLLSRVQASERQTRQFCELNAKKIYQLKSQT